MGADLNKLVKRARSADDRPVVDFHMASELYCVYEYAVVADNAVVGNVDICHEEAVLADHGFVFVACAAADGDVFADDGVVADECLCFLSREFEVLGYRRYGGAGIDANAFTEPCAIPDHGIRADPAVVVNDYVGLNGGKCFNGNVFPDFGIGVDISQLVKTHAFNLCGRCWPSWYPHKPGCCRRSLFRTFSRCRALSVPEGRIG